VDARNGDALKSVEPPTNHPRTFEEIVAAEEPAEQERWERAETFQDPGFAGRIRQVTMIEDQRRNGGWVVECFDADGAPYTTIVALASALGLGA
jgi:hypothetical protein